jgi:galactarate dehydratase
MQEKPLIIKVSKSDNVGIVVNSDGLKKGTILDDGTLLTEFIPFGHKVALHNISTGEKIIRYNQVIGLSNKMIMRGEWIRESKVDLPESPDLDSIELNDDPLSLPEPLNGYTFKGFRNQDGSTGTKNVLGIATSVSCVSGFTNFIAEKIRKELLNKYPNVDDVIPLNHAYGCGVAIDATGSEIPVRTLRNISANPNFGNVVMIIGLGCEKLFPERLVEETDQISRNSRDRDQRIIIMQDESMTGFQEITQKVMELAERQLKVLNARERVEVPASDLIVGMQCGGSDSFSGITANPVAGFAADLIVRAGGSVMFSEVTEVRDAVHKLIPRTIDHETGRALINEMKWYDEYLLRGGTDTSANPTPGNKEGGISNIVEKALGSVAKSGSTPIVDVLRPGEKIRKRGLTFAATPASDFICGTLQVASGMNVHVFMTGRGSPYGLSMVPVIKVSSNSRLGKRWSDLIDLDAGQVASGFKTIEEMGWELFHLILEVASGEKKVACDRLGLHNDLVLFNPGPVT